MVRPTLRTALVGLALALLPAQALAAEPSSAPRPEVHTQGAQRDAAGTPEPAPQSAPRMLRGAAGADSCDELQARIKARTLVAQDGKNSAACVRPGDEDTLTSRRMEVLADRTPVPVPDYCYDLATGDGAWWYTRTDACSISVWTLDIHDIRTGKLTGQLSCLQADLIFTGADAPYWSHQVAIDKTDGWGRSAAQPSAGEGPAKATAPSPALTSTFPGKQSRTQA